MVSQDQPWLGVEVEDDRFVRSEEGFELVIRQPMWVLSARHQLEQVHHAHEPDLHVGEVLAKQDSGGQGFHGRKVRAASLDHVGLGALVVTGPAG